MIPGKDKKTKKSSIKRIVCSCLILVIAGAFTVLSPKWYLNRLEIEPYRNWMEHKTEPSVSVINVWHIVGFKPYAGSLGSWLNAQAKRYSKRFIGIHFEVASLSPEEASDLLKRGKRPDMVSFRKGTDTGCVLTDVTGNGGTSVDYCASGRVLLYEPSFGNDDINDMKAQAGTVEDFKLGKTIACITDIRGAGDIERAQLMGKAPYFEIEPIEAGGELVQSIGIVSGEGSEKLPYMLGFIEYLLTEEAQSGIARAGLLPVIDGIEADFERDFLRELYIMLLQNTNGYGNIHYE